MTCFFVVIGGTSIFLWISVGAWFEHTVLVTVTRFCGTKCKTDHLRFIMLLFALYIIKLTYITFVFPLRTTIVLVIVGCLPLVLYLSLYLFVLIYVIIGGRCRERSMKSTEPPWISCSLKSSVMLRVTWKNVG